MDIISKYQNEPFLLSETAKILRMEKHKPQVIAWIRRHVKPFIVDTSRPQRVFTKLDLINIFELYLIKTLSRYNVRLGFIGDVISRDQITEIIRSTKLDYIVISGVAAFITAKPMEFLKRMGGMEAVIIIDTMKIKNEIFAGIKRARG
ncbi:MAG: hypothetical protein MUP71_11665 [Candidatus Aminicenantes bacterium]|nr:hypothetical protein [Candidatus Aminicenantes bacterium]